jgi:ribonuclease HI
MKWIHNLYLVKKNILQIYTDGSHNSSRLGGIGILFIDKNDNEIEYSYNITKNIIVKEINNLYLSKNYEDKNGIPANINFFIDHIELYAIFQALKKLEHYKTNDKVIIYTDSDVAYLFINNINRTKKGDIKRIKHELSRKLTTLIQTMIIESELDIEIRSVKSHSGVYGNVKVDKLAGVWRKQWDVSRHNNKSTAKNRTSEWEKNLISNKI